MGAHIKWITASYTGDDFPSIKFSLTLSKFEAFIYSAPNTYTLIFGRYHRTYMIMGRMRWWYAIPLLLIMSVDAVSHAIRALFYQNAQMLMLECSVECVHLNCKNIKIILHWFNAIDDSHKKWHLSKHYCFITSKAQKFRENGMAAKRWVSERQWMNASKNIAMNVSTNDSCRSCTKYKQCPINCYWMVNWIFEPRELVMPRINICRKAFWAQSFALELWIKTEIMVHIRNMNIGFEIWNVNMA